MPHDAAMNNFNADPPATAAGGVLSRTAFRATYENVRLAIAHAMTPAEGHQPLVVCNAALRLRQAARCPQVVVSGGPDELPEPWGQRPQDEVELGRRIAGVAGDNQPVVWTRRRRLHGGEELHDLLVLTATAVGRQVGGPRGIDRHPDRTILSERLVGDGRRGPDGGFGRGLIAATSLDAAFQVQDDPGIGGLLEVEFLDLDLAVAGGRSPVDAVHAVARCVRPDRHRERRRLERPLR